MPSRYAKAPWCTVMVWATCRNRISSSRSSPWVRDSSRWTLGNRAYTAGSAGMIPSMCANLKKPRALHNIDTTEESIRPRSPRLRMYSSTWARWTPTKGSSPLRSHQAKHSRSWNAYKWWVRPE